VQRIGLVSLVVPDYDEAIAFYTQVVGFELVEDIPQPGKRWVVVAPPGGAGTALLLARATTDEQASRIGNQTGGRVFLFLSTDQFTDDYERMRADGVHFTEQPRHEVYGRVVVWQDPWGNRWDLLEQPGDGAATGQI
jgi:catechol 2,3-dioxygenase-like lactoylglutathione lyase family enzyme